MIAEPVSTERDLWRIWEGRQLPVELVTRDGESLRVLFPGVANSDAGPDFVGAHLAFRNGKHVRGDVELHLEATSWERHGHHADPRYDRVILHVVLLDDGGPARTSAGSAIPLLALGSILKTRSIAGGSPAQLAPCHDPTAPRAPIPNLNTHLEEAGLQRFEARATSWEADLSSKADENCVLQALLCCAGLGKNGGACLALARALDGRVLEAVLDAAGGQADTVASAVLLGMGGLLEPAHACQEVRDAWLAHRDYWPGIPLAARQWHRFRLRPANLPENRLRLIAAIIARHGLGGFQRRLIATIDAAPPPAMPHLLALLAGDGRGAGRDWGLEAWTNVLLPLAVALARSQANDAVAARGLTCYRRIPGGGQSALLTRMATIAGLPAPPRRAVEQQGLLRIWAEYCSQQRCTACPLAAGKESTPGH